MTLPDNEDLQQERPAGEALGRNFGMDLGDGKDSAPELVSSTTRQSLLEAEQSVYVTDIVDGDLSSTSEQARGNYDSATEQTSYSTVQSQDKVIMGGDLSSKREKLGGGEDSQSVQSSSRNEESISELNSDETASLAGEVVVQTQLHCLEDKKEMTKSSGKQLVTELWQNREDKVHLAERQGGKGDTKVPLQHKQITRETLTMIEGCSHLLEVAEEDSDSVQDQDNESKNSIKCITEVRFHKQWSEKTLIKEISSGNQSPLIQEMPEAHNLVEQETAKDLLFLEDDYDDSVDGFSSIDSAFSVAQGKVLLGEFLPIIEEPRRSKPLIEEILSEACDPQDGQPATLPLHKEVGTGLALESTAGGFSKESASRHYDRLPMDSVMKPCPKLRKSVSMSALEHVTANIIKVKSSLEIFANDGSPKLEQWDVGDKKTLIKEISSDELNQRGNDVEGCSFLHKLNYPVCYPM